SFRPVERAAAPATAGPAPCAGTAREESEEPETSALPVTDSANVVRQAWPAILESVKRRRPSVAGFLREGVPTKLQGNEITCEFPQRFMFHKQQFDDQAKRAIVEEAAEEVLGAKYIVNYLLAEPPAQKQQGEALTPDRKSDSQPREQAQTVAGDPLVRKITEVFEARVVSVEE
ncbi:MAG: hypothetical protein RDV41_12280, partial [Planctomycetota bacterium]|nr:hypothetical protein [Planctomycetota bacterium]